MYSSSVYSCHLFFISSALLLLLGPYHFCPLLCPYLHEIFFDISNFLEEKISHPSKVILKIPQAMLQQYLKHELPDVKAGFRKGRETRDQIANIHWIIEKATDFLKNIHFSFADYAKAFDCVDHNKLWTILKKMEIPDHLTCLPRNLCRSRSNS